MVALLGIKIDNLPKQEVIYKIEQFLSENIFRQIATVNPEFILKAEKDKSFKKILNNCDLNIADGIGVRFAFWRFGKNLKCRFSGIDLMRQILQIADKKKLKVFLVANKNGLSTWQETADAINKKYPKLLIEGINTTFQNLQNSRCQILDANCQLIFCNFGAPYQEKFIAKLKKENTDIKLAMGVGGSFDFISGKIKRAPKWLRFLGLEWLWRLFQQQHRLKRIFKAVIIFPIKVILNK